MPDNIACSASLMLFFLFVFNDIKKLLDQHNIFKSSHISDIATQ